jgi:hypothetical protein
MSSQSEPTADEVAKWMLDELNKVQYLYQQDAVYGIESMFGSAFVYLNDAGNPAIDRKVLAAFKKLTGESVIWERGERLWRKREQYDEPGRLQS